MMSYICENCDGSCIRHFAFLNSLPVEKQDQLMKHALHRKHEKGSYLFHEGDAVSSIFLIRKGRVKLSTFDTEGREHIIGIFSDSDTIWEGIFLEESRYPYSAACLSSVYSCQIDRKEFEATLKDPQIALQTIGLLSKKLHDANERNLLLSTANPKARIAGFLLYRSERNQGKDLALRLEDIASSLSLRPETVSRKLKELVQEGLIARRGQSIYSIKKHADLKELFKS